MTIEIVVVGTELLLGQTLDTNSRWLAGRLAELGLTSYRRTTVGDNERRLAEALSDAASRADAVLVCGGLGPTVDDVTREAIALAFARPLRRYPELLERIQIRFRDRGLAMTPNNERQADVPEGGESLENPAGSAPGVWLEVGGRLCVAMPGVPREMKEMFDASVAPRLVARAGGPRTIRSRVLHVVGLPESHVDAAIEDLFRTQSNPTIGILAHPGQVDIRLTAAAADPDEAWKQIAAVEPLLRARLDPHVFGADADTLEGVCGERLIARAWTMAVAESCTGGLLAARLTSVPGASRWFLGGVTAYANAAKSSLLDVEAAVLARDGAVSEACARGMAVGLRGRTGADLTLAVTGIAGPDGGTIEKPVGTVCFGLATPAGTLSRVRRFPGDRDGVRRWAAAHALEWLWHELARSGSKAV